MAEARTMRFLGPRRCIVLALGAIALGAAGCDRRSTPPLPLEAGKPGVLEFTVEAIKFAPRRKTYFLSSSTNFRGGDASIVAIRQADLKGAPGKVLPDLEARFYGQRIRAEGDARQDEGQLMLFVRSLEQVAIVAPANGAEPKPSAPPRPHRSKHAP